MVNNYSALANDIANRFPGQTSASGQYILSEMNSLTVDVVGEVPMPDVLIWAADFGVTSPLKDLSNNTGPLQSYAASVVLALQGGYPSLDMSDPSIQNMFGQFAASGIVSSAASSGLTELATSTISYVQQTYGTPLLTIDDIYLAFLQ